MSAGPSSPLDRWMSIGRTRWPDITLDPFALARQLAALAIDPSLDHPQAADLYLACALADGTPQALVVFEHELLPVVKAAARRIDSSADFADEVAQVTRERLLVARPDAGPRIAEYAGRGPLAAWVRIAAMRIAMNLLRDRRRNVLVDDETLFEVMARLPLEERDAAGARYAAAVSQAVHDAFATLSPRERNLLRMHYLHGLTVDELAPTYKVHRATVARWIARAREQLLAHTRETLRSRLDLNDSDVDSILRQLSGRIDVTVSRLLAE